MMTSGAARTTVHAATWSALPLLLLVACSGSAAGPANPAPKPPIAVGGTAGDTGMFGARFVGSEYGRASRVTYELGRPAYVTLLMVTADAITAIVPAVAGSSEILGSGEHTVSLRSQGAGGNSIAERFGRVANEPEDDVSAGALREYDDCLMRARAADRARATGPRPVIGHDSTGRPIYGPAEQTATDVAQSQTRYCTVPKSGGATPAATAVQPAQPGRYLILFTSDTPIKNKDVTELVVTAGDINGTAIMIGRNLFGLRGGKWSAAYIPW